jgi:hypothetical protein
LRCSDDDISTEKRVLSALQLLQYYSDEGSIKHMARDQLNNMKPYARELYFSYVVKDEPAMETSHDGYELLPSISLNLSSDQRSWIFDLFLDEFDLESADIPG